MKLYFYLVAITTIVFQTAVTAQEFVDGTFFLDTFDDGNHRDSDPVYWARGDFDAIADNVVDGDLHYQGIRTANGSSMAPSQNGGGFWSYEDVSVSTQFRILESDGTDTYAGVYGRSTDSRVYFGILREDGRLSIGESDLSGATLFADRLPTELDPVAHDVIMRMDYAGDLMSLWAWNANDPMPTSPLLTYQDSTLPSGTVALIAGGVGADVAFRWAEVSAVPEPTSSLLAWLAAAAVAVMRRRNR